MPAAPPPPPEVKVRTMRSDLDAMAKSGGGAPHFETVTVAGLSIGKAHAPQAVRPSVADAVGAAGRNKNRNTIIIVVVVIAAAAILTLCYVAYRIFFIGAGTTSVQSGAPSNAATTTAVEAQGDQSQTVGGGRASVGVAPAATTSAPAPVAAPVPMNPPVTTGPFIHATLFRKQADQTLLLTLSLGGAATTAQDLESFSQKLSGLLAGANKNARMIEVAMEGTDGHGVAAGDVLAQANASFLSAQALADFNPDATFFAYQDQNGFWPGMVLALNPGNNWLFAENDVQPLESSPAFANLFLSNVGAPAAGGFTAGTVGSTTVRSVAFPNANPPATFLYGWYQSYLIISTSRNGFAAAMNLLN